MGRQPHPIGFPEVSRTSTIAEHALRIEGSSGATSEGRVVARLSLLGYRFPEGSRYARIAGKVFTDGDAVTVRSGSYCVHADAR